LFEVFKVNNRIERVNITDLNDEELEIVKNDYKICLLAIIDIEKVDPPETSCLGFVIKMLKDYSGLLKHVLDVHEVKELV
jgi:hypothetical protein